MSYQYFSLIYDHLMDEAPYDGWYKFFEKHVEQYHPSATKVLDLACGTGEMTLRLYENGYEVTGVDLSEDMLAIAEQKAFVKGYKIPFYRQNMTDLAHISDFDVVVIFCDSLNYLLTEEEVKRTFRSVYNVLNRNGLVLFDVHSVHKIDHVFKDSVFAYNGEPVSYIWNCFPGDRPHSVEHELTFFVRDDAEGKYNRYDEFHHQRTFPVTDYTTWLKEAGFDVLSITGDFTGDPPGEETERVFFSARKK